MQGNFVSGDFNYLYFFEKMSYHIANKRIYRGRQMEKLNTLAKKLKLNEYDVEVFDDIYSANEYIASLCIGKIVGLGDSHTIRDMGLFEVLQKQNNNLTTCFSDKSKENKLKTIASDIFLLSANAIAEDTGEMVNVDSSCNRVAGSLYGPPEVIFIIGKNKIEPNLSAAISRARNIAAPLNAKAHNYTTPCVKTGKCENCFHPQRICRATVIYHKRPKPMKVTVVLINKDLGF